MVDLSRCDVEAVLRVLPELYAVQRPADLPQRVLHATQALVPADLIGYDQIDLRSGQVVSFSEPVSSLWQGLLEVFAAHHADHPCKADYERTGNGRARLISDFCSAREWEATNLFNECYRPQGLRDQLSIALTPPTSGSVVAVALNRSRRNFRQRDKTVLDLLRPHLMQAYHIAYRFERYEALMREQQGRGRGTVKVRWPRLLIDALDGEAKRLLDNFFPGWGRTPTTLPAELGGPVAAMLARYGLPEMLCCSRTLTLAVRGRRLDVTIRLVEPGLARDAWECCLLLEETVTAPCDVLSRREQEIADLLPLGLSNKEIAARLGISPKTVGKHLENIFDKLGVTRRAAVGGALRG